MFRNKLFAALILITGFQFQSCKESEKKKDILSKCVEWELEKAKKNGKKVILTENKKIYLVFHSDGTYEYYHKKNNGEKIFNYSEITDNFVTKSWSLDVSEKTLFLNSFKNVKLIQLDESRLFFASEGVEYYFVCSCR